MSTGLDEPSPKKLGDEIKAAAAKAIVGVFENVPRQAEHLMASDPESKGPIQVLTDDMIKLLDARLRRVLGVTPDAETKE